MRVPPKKRLMRWTPPWKGVKPKADWTVFCVCCPWGGCVRYQTCLGGLDARLVLGGERELPGHDGWRLDLFGLVLPVRVVVRWSFLRLWWYRGRGFEGLPIWSQPASSGDYALS